MAIPDNAAIQQWYGQTKRLPLRNVNKIVIPSVFSALRQAGKKSILGIGALVAWELLEETGIIDNLKDWVFNNPDIPESNQTQSVNQLVGITAAILEQISASTNGKSAIAKFEEGDARALYYTQKYSLDEYDDWTRTDYQSKKSRRATLANMATRNFRNRFAFRKNR